MAITRDQVLEAARTVAAEGKEPTYVNVRQKLGTGSFTTIQKYLRDWRAADQAEPEAKPATLPEAFTDALNRFGGEAWKAASSWAKDEIEAARRAYEEKAREQELELERAGATVDALQESLNAAEGERDRLRREAEELKTTLAAAEGTLSEVRRQGEAMLADERAKTQAVRREGDAREAKAEDALRQMERRAIEGETRAKGLDAGLRALKEELAREHTSRETAQAEAAKLAAELDAGRGRVQELIAERDKEREEARTFIEKLEEWVRRATEAETRLAMVAEKGEGPSGT
jgi:chromosome segregation ATPase